MSELLNKQGRENKIQEIVKDSGLGKTKVKASQSLLARGMNKMRCYLIMQILVVRKK